MEATSSKDSISLPAYMISEVMVSSVEIRRINRMSDLERMSRYRRKPVEYKKGSISPLSLEETSP